MTSIHNLSARFFNQKKKTICQRYGPPPSYPHLKIPGLNAPIPPGASFGYGLGDWGKPPVDEVCYLLKIVFCTIKFCMRFLSKLPYRFLPTAWAPIVWRYFWSPAAG